MYLGIGLGTVILLALLEAARIAVTFRAYQVGWVESLRLHVIGGLFGNVLPGQLGSDAYKVVRLRRKAGGLIRPTALLIALRLCGLLALVVGATISGMMYWNELNDGFIIQSAWSMRTAYWLAILIVIVVGISVLTLTWTVHDRRERRGRAIVNGFTYARAQARAAFQELGWKSVGVILALSGVLMLVRTGMLLAIAESVQAELGFLGAMLVATMAALGTQLPISVAGLGVREGLIVILMSQLGVGYDQAFLAALISRAFVVMIAFSGAMWLLFDLFVTRQQKLPH
jgi:uncharacterized membrane protein YbhN (UPF0104 family)